MMDHENLLPVTIDIEITKILLIDEVREFLINQFYLKGFVKVKTIFKTQHFLNMSWIDQRVSFLNLKHETFHNILPEREKSLLWYPSVTFFNTPAQVTRLHPEDFKQT